MTSTTSVNKYLAQEDEIRIISNHSGYDYKGSENFEHDDNGNIMNYSGVYDDVMSAFAESEGWVESYDY